MSLDAARLSDTYTTTGNGNPSSTTAQPFKAYALQVKGTGAAATSWDVRLEGSLDGTNWQQILQHNATDGSVVWSNANVMPCTYIRTRCAAVTLGGATNIVAKAIGSF